MKVKLLVIRTGDMQKLAKFYELLGFTFDYHKHGDSPYHYSATVGETVIEIYPLIKSQTEADKSLRLGFEIDNFDTIIELLKENNIVFAAQPVLTTFGLMSVVIDPDGRKIELYKK
ncbi:VOC family protein [Mucilaginibacter ginsenosidivorax]|uniref:Glyoxalase/bleomycin resistance/extradiol dioxygenase family protein n=1 Tax=Mucilaginibacter ginsenosidivorax TaxID=862126 RepID=A0A5B8VX57_9SPHI|nr:VOC family protein [Mucilaginibacter ginsenosidivorax]QEC75502.1 glyoxalase/bleomycin resistance/extradiol dioxygenase family protein [Mucilaginibacter ginsenosidivorax]